MVDLSVLAGGLPVNPLPKRTPRSSDLPHAPDLQTELDEFDRKLALANALRYIPADLHNTLAAEFAEELAIYGHIYMYRFRPDRAILKAHPIDCYPTQCKEAAAIMLMISNNLDQKVAQFPEELVTYGGNGQVFSNWAQFWLVMKALSRLDRTRTLVLYSGHPLGLFLSHELAPRMVVTNGMIVPRPGMEKQYANLFALGVTQYGQMTAGSFCYIGPQGIVHGTTLTLLNAFRRHFALQTENAQRNEVKLTQGKVFLSSGLGGMSGAQAKAAVITGCIGVIAEVSEEALDKRHKQGWLDEKITDLEQLIKRIRKCRVNKEATSLGYLGNVVDVWERLVKEYESTGELLVDIASDQTSCHNPFHGGYYPCGYTYEQSRKMMTEDPVRFRAEVQRSLRIQVHAINKLAHAGIYFFDYGNAFLLQAKHAGADVKPSLEQTTKAWKQRRHRDFRYPSYVQDIMGDIFSLGFGPFRWVCTSGSEQDLELTDKLAEGEILRLMQKEPPPPIYQQFEDNLKWIREAKAHKLVVGSKARILYSDEMGRTAIARAFHEAVADGRLEGPIILSRDHHDVSGTDSPYRETSNIYDGSAVCADMSVQNVIGGAIRGATWVSLHNGGGVGWGEVMNGGFGHLLDGTAQSIEKACRLLSWDVTNGLARRAWSGHPLAKIALEYANKNRYDEEQTKLEVLFPECIQEASVLEDALKQVFG